VLKTTPQIRQDGVSLDFQLEIRSLGTTSVNGIPIINNREYKGFISAADGEPIVIAGLITRSEQNNLSGIPLLSQIPGLGLAFGTKNKQYEDEELLLVVTPHILLPREKSPQELRLPATTPR
jgi:general secretion pathway protein D